MRVQLSDPAKLEGAAVVARDAEERAVVNRERLVGPAAVAVLLAGLVAGALVGVCGMLAGLANGAASSSPVFLRSLTAPSPGALDRAWLLRIGLQQRTTVIGGTAGTEGREDQPPIVAESAAVHGNGIGRFHEPPTKHS